MNAAPEDANALLDEEGTIRVDLACFQCDYNLRTLRRDGRCPECGLAVRSTVEAIRAWFTRVSHGSMLMAASYLGYCVAFVQFLLALHGEWLSLACAGVIGSLGAFTIGGYAGILMTSHLPAASLTLQALRLVTRGALVVAPVLALTALIHASAYTVVQLGFESISVAAATVFEIHVIFAIAAHLLAAFLLAAHTWNIRRHLRLPQDTIALPAFVILAVCVTACLAWLQDRTLSADDWTLGSHVTQGFIFAFWASAIAMLVRFGTKLAGHAGLTR